MLLQYGLCPSLILAASAADAMASAKSFAASRLLPQQSDKMNAWLTCSLDVLNGMSGSGATLVEVAWLAAVRETAERRSQPVRKAL